MPMAPVSNSLVWPQQGIFLPDNNMSNPDCHNQLASGATVFLDRSRFGNRLDNVCVASLGFATTETGFQPVDIAQEVIVVWFPAVTAWH